MDVLFVAYPVEDFKVYKDTTYVMMREAQRRGHTVWLTTPRDLSWQSGHTVEAQAQRLKLLDVPADAHTHQWTDVEPAQPKALRDFGVVLMRADPPFDSEYFYATHLLEHAEREGAKVFNSPRALRDHPEKLAIMAFDDLISPTLVTRQADDIRAFHRQHGDIILKPLDGMGGMGIFRVGADGLNLGSIIETLNRDGAQSVMVQRYIPDITQGDKRVLVIAGEVVPFCLARIPQGGEVRGNLAAGGKGVAQPVSESDLRIARTVAERLQGRGLLLMGLDIIGTCLTEINVTSPTCFREIMDQTGCDVGALFWNGLEQSLHT